MEHPVFTSNHTATILKLTNQLTFIIIFNNEKMERFRQICLQKFRFVIIFIQKDYLQING